jgi:hypothetical protein
MTAADAFVRSSVAFWPGGLQRLLCQKQELPFAPYRPWSTTETIATGSLPVSIKASEDEVI